MTEFNPMRLPDKEEERQIILYLNENRLKYSISVIRILGTSVGYIDEKKHFLALELLSVICETAEHDSYGKTSD